MLKIILVAVAVTVVGLFVLTQIDPVKKDGGGSPDTVIVDTSGGTVKVTITGNVLHPGEYLMSPNSTLGDLILKAGGALAGSDPDSYSEGLVIGSRTAFYIATKAEIPESCIITDIEKVNVNSATREQLASLGGFNSAQIDALLAYRTNEGQFYCLEDIMKVSGIGEKTYLSVRDKITIA